MSGQLPNIWSFVDVWLILYCHLVPLHLNLKIIGCVQTALQIQNIEYKSIVFLLTWWYYSPVVLCSKYWICHMYSILFLKINIILSISFKYIKLLRIHSHVETLKDKSNSSLTLGCQKLLLWRELLNFKKNTVQRKSPEFLHHGCKLIYRSS